MTLVVLRDQLDDSTKEVAQVMSQIAVVDMLEAFPTKFSISRKRALTQKEIAKSLGVEFCNDVHRLHDIPQCFAELFDLSGFFILAVDKAVAKDHARRLQVGSDE